MNAALRQHGQSCTTSFPQTYKYSHPFENLLRVRQHMKGNMSILCMNICHHCFLKLRRNTHLSNIKKIDLQKEAQSRSRHLVGCTADGIAYFVANGQPGFVLILRKNKQRKYTELESDLLRYYLAHTVSFKESALCLLKTFLLLSSSNYRRGAATYFLISKVTIGNFLNFLSQLSNPLSRLFLTSPLETKNTFSRAL